MKFAKLYLHCQNKWDIVKMYKKYSNCMGQSLNVCDKMYGTEC